MSISISEVIAMAWADEIPFSAIEKQTGLSEREVIALMRSNLKRQSFKLWRKRVNGRTTKHLKLRENREINFLKFKCSKQKNISNNKFK